MNTDTAHNRNGALVARQNQSNSIGSSSQNSLLNDPMDGPLTKPDPPTSNDTVCQLANSTNDANQSDVPPIDHAEIVNRLTDCVEENSTNRDNRPDNHPDKNADKSDNGPLNSSDDHDDETNSDESRRLANEDKHISEENEAIQKLGLSLDYHPATNLSELEQSFSSLTSSAALNNKSETSSIRSTSSRANSPSRTSQRSLPFPPLKSIKRDTSETNLLISEIEPRSHEEQVRYFRIERANLLHLSSLIINNLIKTISPLTKTLECHDNAVLYDFFSITELICKHGLKSRKGLIFGKKELWNVLESIENMSPQNTEIMQNIRELPNVKTNNGRVKAFLRLAFIHKVFNEIFTYLVGCKELLRSFYEDEAFIQSEEMNEFLLKTEELKDFDFRWCAKDDKLDELSNLIDLTDYLVDKERTTREIIYKVNVNQQQIKELIEEKQFFESKSREFRNRILFYYNRIKELGIESVFEGELAKSPSKIELLTKKLNEFFKTPLTVVENRPDKNPDIISLEEDIATLKKALEIELSNRASKEAALEYIESDVLVKQDENIVMRHQIEEVKQVNEELCAKVGELGQLNTDLNAKTVALTSKNQQLVSNVTELQRTLVATEAKYNQLSTTERLLRKQYEELRESNESLKAQLLREQEEKAELQKRLDDHIARNSTVTSELSIATSRANDYPSLKKKHDVLQRKVYEYEQTMEEIGTQLQAAKLEIENLKEANTPSDCVWKDDSNVAKCEGCSALFTTINRRHHCRSCGGIFCQKCSDRKIPLPANSKPCRVCDNCHTKLLQRYNG